MSLSEMCESLNRSASVRRWLLLTCTFTTCAMTGLIWLVQLVHYPLMNRVPPDRFPEFEIAHSRGITPIVLPLMTAELISSVLLCTGRDRRERKLWLTGLLALAGIWGSTFFVQVPLHEQLAAGFQEVAWQRLVSSNWIRTVLWSVRSVLLMVLLNRSLKS